MKNILLLFISSIVSFNSLFCKEDIDIVYTWVDGSDESWKNTLSTFIATYGLQDHAGADSLSKKRFRNHDELKYSLRSIQAFAPWVHHIYIVTCGQKPKWFRDHPKITFVDHSSIFKKSQDLPTYNSMAIESNLHRIPGLSEHYLYFNDDVFLGHPTTPKNFFTEDGKFQVFFSKHFVATSTPELGEEGFYAACKNTLSLVNSLYKNKPRYQHSHTPFPSIKSVVSKIEAMHPDVFSLVSSHHFRSLHDYTLTNGLIPYVALERKWARVSPERSLVVHICQSYEKDALSIAEVEIERPMFFCLQDGGGEETPAMTEQLQSFFTGYFPEKADWERDESQSENPVESPYERFRE